MNKIEKYSWPEDVVILKGVLTQESFPVHSHDFCEIAIIQSGQGVYTDNYGERPLLPGDVFILRKPEYHGFSKIEKLKIINIIFIQERLAMPLDELRKITGYNVLFEIEPLLHGGADRSSLNLSPEELQQLSGCVKMIEHELEQKQPGYRIKLRSLVLDVIIFLSRKYSSDTDHGAADCHRRLGETIALKLITGKNIRCKCWRAAPACPNRILSGCSKKSPDCRRSIMSIKPESIRPVNY